MKFSVYIKQHWEWAAAAAGMVTVTNLVLCSSFPLKAALNDILYLDLLLLFIMITGFFAHYRRLCKAFHRIKSCLDEQDGANFLFDEISSMQKLNTPGIDIMKSISEISRQEIFDAKESSRLRLEELNDYLTQTVHDVKINLAVCEMAANRLENKSEIHNKLIYQIEQIKFRINQVLSISRASCFEDDITPEPIEIRQVVKDAVGDNSEFFIIRNISIKTDLPYHSFISDRKWVRYILSQILNNCSKYTADSGELRISGYEEQSAYRLLIRDNGVGIPESEISRVFDKGFTGTNGRMGNRSTGMGLYYAKKMADILGIGLKVESERDVYTEFFISFYKISDYLRQQA